MRDARGSRAGRAGAGSDRPAADLTSNLRWFRLFVLMHVPARTFLQLGAQPSSSWYVLNSQALILCCPGGLLPSYTMWANFRTPAAPSSGDFFSYPLEAMMP